MYILKNIYSKKLSESYQFWLLYINYVVKVKLLVEL